MVDTLGLLKQCLGDHTKIDSKGNVQFYCISCKHKNKKLAVNVNTLKFQCWVCGEKGNISKYLYKNGFRDIANKLQPHREEVTLDNLFGDKKKVEEEKITLSFPKNYYGLYANKNKLFFKSPINYLYNRGLTEDDLIKYDIHYSIKEERILFPSYDIERNLNYYVTRSIINTSYMKYKNADVRKDDIIFNEHMIDWKQALYIVEGVFDAISCRDNAVPLLGSSLSKSSALYKKIVKNNTPIILALDPDAKKKMFKCAENIITFNTNVFYIEWGDEIRDISEMGSEYFLEFSNNNKKKYTLNDEVLSRLL